MGRFKDACASYSGPRPKCMLLHHTYVAADADEADHAAKTLSRYFNYFGAWFQNKRPVTQGLIAALSNEDIAGNKMMAAENLRRDLTIGTKADVIDQIKRYEDLGYDEFSYWIDSGMSSEQKRVSLARFIDDVMPAFS